MRTILFLCFALAALGQVPGQTPVAVFSGQSTTVDCSTTTNPQIPSTSSISFWISADCTALTGIQPADGSSVSTWKDRGPAHDDLSVASGTCTYHTNQVNSQPAVSFSSCHLNLGTAQLVAAEATIFIVLNGSSFATNAHSMIAAETNGRSFYVGNDSKLGMDETGTTFSGESTTTLSTSTWYQVNMVQHTGVAPAYRISRADAGCSGCVWTGFSGSAHELGVGYYSVAAPNNFAGSIAEVIYYGVQLNSTDISTVESYLHNKYNN